MSHQATTFAYFALLAWVPISLLCFVLLRPALAATVVLLGAILFLPERVGFDLRGLPPVEKYSIAVACAALGMLLWHGRRLRAARIGRGIDVVLVVLLLGAVGTALGNEDPLRFGPTTLSALGGRDAVSLAIRDLFAIGVPFIIGRAAVRSPRDLRDVLWTIVVGGLVYSLFILVEVRLSPQWHVWLYGFHQHSFAQTYRFGGFRPMVFMTNGLAVGLFMVVATLAAAVLGRAGERLRGVSMAGVTVWLAFILVLCKSTGAIIYGAALVPVALLVRARWQVALAMALALGIVLYPVLRSTGSFPTKSLVQAAELVSPARAASLEFRFQNETRLLERAEQRPWFGWGGFNRNRVFDRHGRDRTVTDGFWIIELGSRGAVGLAAAFGLLLWPIFVAWRSIGFGWRATERVLIAGTALVLVVQVVDLLPNGLTSPLPFFMAGALLGVTRDVRARRHPRRSTALPPP